MSGRDGVPVDADDGLPVLYDGEIAFTRSDEQPLHWCVKQPETIRNNPNRTRRGITGHPY